MYKAVDEVVNSHMPKNGVFSYIANTMAKKIVHTAVDELKSSIEQYEEVVRITEEHLLNNSQFLNEFGNDFYIHDEFLEMANNGRLNGYETTEEIDSDADETLSIQVK